MYSSKGRFSKRFGHRGKAEDITVREQAPHGLRYAVVAIANQDLSIVPSQLRHIICGVLRESPNSDNWTEFPNVWDEVQGLIYGCQWFQVYDIIEEIYRYLVQCRSEDATTYEEEINRYFAQHGIGWQLADGAIQTRGEESFENTLRSAGDALTAGNLPTAKQELREAIRDLSRRPEPDLSGAVQHSMAALECVARQMVGDPNKTLGEILKHCPQLIPRPLDDAVSKVWGYSSQVARHAREGRSLEREEVQLVVGLAATVATYLVQKVKGRNTDL